MGSDDAVESVERHADDEEGAAQGRGEEDHDSHSTAPLSVRRKVRPMYLP